MSSRNSLRSVPRTFLNVSVPLFFSIMGMLMIAVVWIVVFLQIEIDERNYMNNARLHLMNVARSFKEHSENTIRNADETLRVIKYHYETNGNDDFPLLNNYFSKGVINTEFFNQAGIIDADGQYIFSNLVNHQVIDLSDREHFVVHKEHYSYPIFLSKVVFGRASKKWSVQLTRRMEKPDGSFNGVAVVSFDPTYFINFHRKIELGNNGFTSLLDLNGVVRTLRAGRFSTIEGLKEPLPLPSSVHTEANGSFVSDQLYDGENRIYAFERLSNQPLLVLAGMEIKEVLAEHQEHRKVYLMFAIGLSTVITMFAIGALFTIRRSSRQSAALIQRTHEASTAYRHKTEFLAAISDELATPLKDIMGRAAYISHSAGESDAGLSARVILDDGRHLLTLINSLIELTKVETGRISLIPMQFDLFQAVQEVIGSQADRIESRRIDLDLDLDADPPLLVNMDPQCLKQILINLINNAIEHNKESHAIKIRVTLLASTQQVRIAVICLGTDARPADQVELLQNSVPNENLAVRKYQQSNLELALCKGLVELMGGEIDLRSASNAGSTIFFTLPIGFIKKD